jgi:hypothetical protein
LIFAYCSSDRKWQAFCFITPSELVGIDLDEVVVARVFLPKRSSAATHFSEEERVSFMNPIAKYAALVAVALQFAIATPGLAVPVTYTGADGLSAEADFILLDPTSLQITLSNTSTSTFGGGGANMVLSSINFDLGDIDIIGGSVVLGGGSSVVTNPWWDPIDSGNWVTSHSNGGSALTAFNGDSGPIPGGLKYGIVASGSPGFGGGVFILDSVVLTLTLSEGISGLGFLENGSYVEFGSDFAYVPGDDIHPPVNPEPPVIPEPATLVLVGVGLSLAGASLAAP